MAVWTSYIFQTYKLKNTVVTDSIGPARSAEARASPWNGVLSFTLVADRQSRIWLQSMYHVDLHLRLEAEVCNRSFLVPSGAVRGRAASDGLSC